MDRSNHYTTLGVNNDASPDAIKKAYRQLASQFHPDRNPGDAAAEEHFKAINAAYDVLKDPERKRQYDASRQGWHDVFMSSGHGFNVEDILHEFMAREYNFRTGGFRQPRTRNRDISVSYSITLEEAFHGKDTEIHYIVPNEGRRSTQISIPAGVEHGTKIRYAGLGDHSDQSLPAGDLYVAVQIRQNALFARSGNDLTVHMMIDALDAMTDAEIDIPTLDGKKIQVTLPNGLQSGQVVRVAGHGMPILRGKQRGDLYLHISIKVPTNLTDDEKHILRQMREGILRMHE